MFEKTKLFQQINYQIDIQQYQNLYTQLEPYRYLLMSKADNQARMEINDFNYFTDMAMAQLYGVASYDQKQIESDPLFFFNHIISQLTDFNTLSIQTQDNLFYVKENDLHHYFAFVQLNKSAFTPDYQRQVENLIIKTKQGLAKSKIQLLSFGAVRYAYHAYNQAKKEISTVGLGSLIGILLLFLFVFRSLTPLIASTLSLSTGLIMAFGVTLLVFKQVHLFALVFGSTIAGVSIDYCFHYLTESIFTKRSTNQSITKNILPGLIIGFSSSALVYVGFIITGYAVLAQISLFSIVALLSVLVNVVLFFPLLIKPKNYNHLIIFERLAKVVINNPVAKLFNSFSKTIAVFLISLSLNYFYLQANDDVRALQSLSPDLKIEEHQIKELLSLKSDSRYVLIHAKSIDEVLDLEAMVIQQINQQSKSSDLIGISDFIPSTQQQKQNQKFYQQLYASKPFADYINNIGLNPDIISQQIQNIKQQEPVDYAVINNPSIQTILSQRWLGQINDYFALAIPINEEVVVNSNEEIVVVQQAEDASGLFSKFRIKAINIVALAAALLILLLSVLRYGWVKAMHLVLLPFTAGLIALLVTQLVGLHISLFSVLALLLVLGMGLDYVVFLSEAKNKIHVAFALLLSSVTTILSFGLLSLSQVAVIKSFGFTLATGIFIILLISPAIIKSNSKKTL
jgi:predicted exporter